MRILQIYDTLRNVHMERVQKSNYNIKIVYKKKSYDFDPSLSEQVGAVQLSYAGVMIFLIKEKFDLIEINEPLMLRAWPLTLLSCFIVNIKNYIFNSRTNLCTYAIENNNPVASISEKSNLPTFISNAIVKIVTFYIMNSIKKIAYGTEAAKYNYEKHASVGKVSACLIDSVAPACSHCDIKKKKNDNLLVFVGAFEDRKGIIELLEIWPEVRKYNSDAELLIMGKGELLELVLAKSIELENCDVIIDPAKEIIHEKLSEAKALALLSKPTKTWREQIGLPILEGLSHGCEIVSTPETGVSAWLCKNDHLILSLDDSGLAFKIANMMRREDRSRQILKSLPETDNRTFIINWFLSR